jgi:hypothetical protein
LRKYDDRKRRVEELYDALHNLESVA